MRFVDEAIVKVKAGDGGDGIVSWRREKFVPEGGPFGGDGGKGGDVVFLAKEGLSSLLDLKHEHFIKAQNGHQGQSKNKTGKNGEDKIINVPVGTLIWQIVDGKEILLSDLNKSEDTFLACKGGLGGFGNSHFKGSQNQAPEKATMGFEGEEKEFKLTLKLMADVGLLGFPNVGKSTILTKLSKAKPKIRDYPFTTLKPMLGVCSLSLNKHLVMADIPGLIEGASEGIGLGFRFLKHLERVKILCHVIDAQEENLIDKYLIINNELKKYSEDLYKLPQIIAINKTEYLNLDKIKYFTDFLTKNKIEYYTISAILGEGLEKLLLALFNHVGENKQKAFDPLKNLY